MSIATATAPVKKPMSNSAAAGPSFIQIVGPHPNQRLTLTRPALLLGSHPACDFRFSPDDVAEFHCLLAQVPQGLILRDCHSPSGTLVNGMAVAETALRDGDHVQVGSLQFRVQLPENGQEQQQRRIHGELERLARRRTRLAQLAWRQRTTVLVQARKLAEAEQRLHDAHRAKPSTDGDGAKMREELLRRREQLETFRKELEEREAELMKMQQHVLDQQARVRTGAGGGRPTGAEQASARKELERLKMNIQRLGHDEAKLLENLTTFRNLEAEQKAALAVVQQQLQEQQAYLLPAALLERDQVAQLQRYRIQLATDMEKAQVEADAAKKKAKKLQDDVADLEDELNRLRTEREQEQEAYAREREVQQAAFNAHRAEVMDLAEQKKAFLAERAKQLEELAAKNAEVSRHLASMAELEGGLKRQREAIQHETESWVEQRQSAAGEMTEKQREIEALDTRLKELRTEETHLEKQIAEWNAHADRERQTLDKEISHRRANLDQEMEETKRKLMAEWYDRKEDVTQGLVDFRSQAEQLWEEFLSKLRVEAKAFTDVLPKSPPS